MSLVPVRIFSGRPDVLILGAGAAGLMCAIVAARRGRKVLLLERSNKPGKKILMSGGGRCNFTNLYVEPSRFLSGNPHFCKSALSRYTQWDFIELVERYQIAYHDKGQGQLFCDNSSRDILDMLLQECAETGVQILTDCETRSVEKASRFEISTSAGSISTESLVVATGGLSIPKLGGSGFGYDLARQFGLSVLPLRPGLVPFTFSDPIKPITERLSGLSLDVRLSTAAQEFSGAMLFTHRGLSGPAVLQLSSYWHSGETISIDLLPGANLADWLKQQKRHSPRAVLRTLLAEILPRALVMELQAMWWPQKADTASGEWSDQSLDELANQLTHWQVKPSGTEGYRTAEVTLGGVDTDDISSRTMETINVPGLFFIGEVLDVTGHLGGFNFQWAWSSGHAAGQAA